MLKFNISVKELDDIQFYDSNQRVAGHWQNKQTRLEKMIKAYIFLNAEMSWILQVKIK